MLVATTDAYIAPADVTVVHLISTHGGADTIRAQSKQAAMATADAGNVKFSPDAADFGSPAAAGGFLEGGKTYFYRVSATFPEPVRACRAPRPSTRSRAAQHQQDHPDMGRDRRCTGYKIYRSTETGKELLLATVGAATTYTDNSNTTPSGAMPPEDTNSGWAIASLNVAVIDTRAWLGKNLRFHATGQRPGPAPIPAARPSGQVDLRCRRQQRRRRRLDRRSRRDLDHDCRCRGDQPRPPVGAEPRADGDVDLDNSATADAKQATNGSTTGIVPPSR